MCWFLIFPIQEDGTGSVCTFGSCRTGCRALCRCSRLFGRCLDSHRLGRHGRRGIGNLNDQEMLSNYRGEYPQGIYNTYPFDYRLGWNFINFGPLYLPRKGDTLPIDTSAVRIYYKMIKYESGLNLQEREGQVWCGDSLVERYTFRTNWYFMGGDNMWNSQDSRYLGPIPEEFIIGKATLILTAKDPETKAYRWRRFFTRIRKEVKNR